jgi:hypothetical protein
MGEQNAFDAIERPSPYSHSFSDCQERVGRPGDVLRNKHSYRVNLWIGYRNSSPASAHKAENSTNVKKFQAVGMIHNQPNEDVACEERNLDHFPAITPPMHLCDKGKKRCQALFSQPVVNCLLGSSSDMHGVPALAIGFHQ